MGFLRSARNDTRHRHGGHSIQRNLAVIVTTLVVVLLALAACKAAPAPSPAPAPQYVHTATVPASSIEDYVEPTDRLVRNTAISVIQATPEGVWANSEVWKIWQINYWVANNISYISDPKGQEYYAYAHESLESQGGDCDDFTILLASMYESIGLDAAIAYVDTEGDEQPDHMACLVYYSDTPDSFLDEEKTIMDTAGIDSPTALIRITYIDADQLEYLPDYDEGIWIIADPTMAKVSFMVGYITRDLYNLTSVIEIGN